jgi:LysR family transcriptional regulator for metE and metH
MEVRHLRLIKTVAEEGNLTGAGKKLFLTQSALSHQLKEIETEFKTTLFQRVGKKMILTQAGGKVLSSAKVILGELEKTEHEVKKFVSGDTGILRISTECYTCYHWLPKLLKSYHNHFPNVEIQIVAEATRQPKPYLLDGRLDVAIVSCLQPDITGSANLRLTKLFTDELVVVINKNHKLTSKKTIRAEDFRDQTLITYTEREEMLDVYQRLLIPAGITPAKVIKLQLTEAIVEMVKAEMGITVMAKWVAKPYLKSKQLVIRPFDKSTMKRTWYVATPNSGNYPHYIECFIKHLLSKAIF